MQNLQSNRHKMRQSNVRDTLIRLMIGVLALAIIGLAVFGAAPVSAQGPGNIGVNWTGYYWNNANFSGNFTLTRSDPVINFNWQTGSPDPSIPNDNFSARWYTSINVAAGAYTFVIGAEDGIRIAVDGTVIADIFTNAGSFKTTSATVNLGAGSHSVIVDYTAGTGLAGAQVNIYPASSAPTAIPSGPTVVPSGPVGSVAPIQPLTLNGLVIPSVAVIRSGPGLDFPAVADAHRGDNLVLAGRDGDNGLNTWFLVQLDPTTQGWLPRLQLFIAGDSTQLPVASTTVTPPTGFSDVQGFVRNDTVVYDGPTKRNAQKIGTIPAGQHFQILRISANRAWLFINADGLQGWVFIIGTHIVSGPFYRLPVGN